MSEQRQIDRLQENVLIPFVSGEHIPQDGTQPSGAAGLLPLLSNNREHAFGQCRVLLEYICCCKEYFSEPIIDDQTPVDGIIFLPEILPANPVKENGFCSGLSHDICRSDPVLKETGRTCVPEQDCPVGKRDFRCLHIHLRQTSAPNRIVR